jgi:hypothetical protein
MGVVGRHTLRLQQGKAVVVRKAGDPGMVERIAGFLADNALTRSWSDTVNRHVLGPLERMTVSDEVLREMLPAMVAGSGEWNGRLNGVQVKALEALKGEAVNVAGVEEAVRAAPNAAQEVKDQAVAFLNSYTPSREAQLRAAQVLMDRSNRGIEKDWTYARTLLGSAPVAYSLVGAGGAMGTAAALEAYDWWQSQQQQAEKDKQLPLQGGMAS